MHLQERAKILLRTADLIERHNDEIAALETWDNGKPYAQSAKIEVPMLVRLIRYYAGRSKANRRNKISAFILFSAVVLRFDGSLYLLQDGLIRSMV